MSWFTLSLLSVFCLATAELTQQYILNKKYALNERTSAVLTFLFQSILTLLLIIFSPLKTDLFSIFEVGLFNRTALTGVIASVGMIFYFKSFKVKNISFSNIFISSSAIISTVLGIIYLGESLLLTKFLGIFFIIGAIIILNLNNASLVKNHYYGLLAGVLFGVVATLDKSIVLEVNPLIYIFWAFLMVSIFGFLFNPKSVINSIKGKSINTYVPVLASGLGYFSYNVFTFYAYKTGGDVGSVDAINNSQVFLVILFEFFFLKHTKSIKLKIITAIIAAVGVILLGVK